MDHYLGFDQTIFTDHRGIRPFTLVVCHSTNEEDVFNTRLEKRKDIIPENFASDFLYFASPSSFNSYRFYHYLRLFLKKVLTPIVSSGDKSNVFTNLLPFDTLLLSHFRDYLKTLDASLITGNRADEIYPIVNRADNLASVISYYLAQKKDFIYQQRKDHFRSIYPSLDSRLKECFVKLT